MSLQASPTIELYRGEHEKVSAQARHQLSIPVQEIAGLFRDFLGLEAEDTLKVQVHPGAIALTRLGDRKTPLSAVVLTHSKEEGWTSKTCNVASVAQKVNGVCEELIKSVGNLPDAAIELSSVNKIAQKLAGYESLMQQSSQKIVQLRAKIQELRAEVQSLRQQLESAQKDNASLSDLVKDKDSQIAQLQLALVLAEQQRSEAVQAAELAQKHLEDQSHVLIDLGIGSDDGASLISVASADLQDITNDPQLIAIAQGELEGLFAQPNQALKDGASKLLFDLLDPQYANTPAIITAAYNTAFFLINHNPEALNSFKSQFEPGTLLYGKLRSWLILRNQNPLLGGEREKQDALCVALSSDLHTQLEDLALPIKFMRLKTDIADKENLSADEALFCRLLGVNLEAENLLVTDVRAYLGEDHDPTPLHALIQGLIGIKANLLENDFTDEGDKSADAEDSLYLPSLAENAPSSPFGAMDQLRALPQENHRVGDISWSVPKWKERRSKREHSLETTLASPIDDQAFANLIGSQRSERQIRYQSGPQGASDEAVSYLQQQAEFNAALLLHQGARSQFTNLQLLQVRTALKTRLEALTGLQCTNPQQLPDLFCTAIARGTLPPFLRRLASEGDGSEALTLMQLAYYHTALSHLNPAKPQFAAIAKDTDWDWLLGPQSTDFQHAAILESIVKALHNDGQLQGSVLSAHQVSWVSNIFSVLRGGKGNHIYDQAGNGKTVTARFAITLAKALIPQARELHLFSPFAHTEPGLVCHQYLPGQEQLRANGALSDGALVDEAHALSPDARITLTDAALSTEVEPLHMTATPIIPNYRTIDTRQEVLKELDRTAAQMEHKLTHLQQQIEAGAGNFLAAHRAQLTTKVGEFLPFLKAYSGHLPRARAQRLESALKKFPQEEAIAEILIALSILLMPHQITKSTAVSKIGDTIIYPLQHRHLALNRSEIVREGDLPLNHKWLKEVPQTPQGPLQCISKQKYQDAADQLLRFANDVLALRRALNLGVGASLPEEIVNKFPQQVVENIKESTKLSAECQAVRKKMSSLAEKSNRPLSRAEKEHRDYVFNLEHAENTAFESLDYQHADLTLFSPQTAVAAVNAAFKEEPESHVQLIFPGVCFTEANFVPLLTALDQAEKFQGRPIYYVYHDSHSPQGSPNYGKKLYFKTGMETPRPLAELNAEENAVVVMLYDTTNKQGGDFNGLSNASPGHEISQCLFYHLTDNMGTNPSDHTSKHDLYQAKRRCRGVSENPPIVTGSYPQVDAFLAAAGKRQVQIEKEWAARDAAFLISKKLLKLCLLVSDPRGFSEYQMQKREMRAKYDDDDGQDSPPLIATKDPRSALRIVSQKIPEIATVDLVHILKQKLTQMGPTKKPEDAFAALADGLEEQNPVDQMIKSALGAPKQDGSLWRVQKLQKEISLLIHQATNFGQQLGQQIVVVVD